MTSKNSLIIAGIFFVLLAALIGFTLLNNPQYRFKGTLISPPAEAYDISLVDANDSTFRLSDQLGKVVLIFFGYTHCPDVCPTTLADYRAIYEQLGSQTDQVKFVYISVDPERDTPEIMDRYAKAFNPEFIGLSGDEDHLQPVYQHYGVFHEKTDVESEENYLVNHTSVIYVIDKQGMWRMTFPFELGPLEMLDDVLYLVNE